MRNIITELKENPFRLRWKIVLVLTVLTLSSFYISSQWQPSQEFHAVSLEGKPNLKTGDIIFRRGRGFASQFVLVSDKASEYSHVGVVDCRENEVLVIHSGLDDFLGSDGNYVRSTPLAEFISGENCSAVSVYRLKSKFFSFIDGAMKAAKQHVTDKTPFDKRFDLESDEELYCTEFIWRIFVSSGIDLIEDKTDIISIPFGSGSCILPSALIGSSALVNVFSVSVNYGNS